jgi:serine protease AprX
MTDAIRRLPIGLALVLTVLSGADTRTSASAQPLQRLADKLDTTLQAVVENGETAPQRVIIRTRPGRRAALRESLRAHGDRILSEHASLDALTAVVHGGDLAALADSDAILSVSRDAIVRPHGQLLGGLLRRTLRTVLGTVGDLVTVVGNILLPNGADTSGPVVSPAVLRETLGVHDTSLKGRGVGVAVIDSGLEMSQDFSGRVRAFYDFTDGRQQAAYPSDEFGHGTHVAGTIGSSGALSHDAAYRGLAPEVGFVILKVLDESGSGYTSDVIRAIDFAVANRSRFGIDIINLSLGHPIFEPAARDPLVQAVERASQAGIVVVVAAGNLGKNPETGLPGYAGVTSPGNAPSAITSGAVQIENTVPRGDDRIPDYSSAGPTWYDAFAKPDIVSPGHNIVASAAKNGYLYRTYPQLAAADADYMLLSGTSMATAVTTGSIALLLEANREANGPDHPPLTPNATKALLHYTAVGIQSDLGLEYDPLRKGAGALNARGAIDLGRRIDTSTPTGEWWLTSTPSPWTVIGGETYFWNEFIVWGNRILWGSTVAVNSTWWSDAIIWGSTDAAWWSDAIIWGSTDATWWSDAIIWGSDAVWTDSYYWSDAIIWGSDSIGHDQGGTIAWGTAGPTAESTAWQDVSDSGTTATGQ